MNSGAPVSGERAVFIGDEMAAVVEGVRSVWQHTGRPPVVVGGLAVLSRLSTPYRATTDLDVVDRRLDGAPHLELLRAAEGARAEAPAAVHLQTRFGPVKVDVLEVRQAEIDRPSDDPGDRLHATAHAWAYATATDVTIEVVGHAGHEVTVTTPLAEPGPLIAMKLQAVENRSADKQGTDLLDIVHLTFDARCRDTALTQLGQLDAPTASDVFIHVQRWFVHERRLTTRRIREAGGHDVTTDDLDLVADLLLDAASRVT